MKISNDNTRSCVKVTTGNEIEIVNYPKDTGCSDDFICAQLGNGCKYLDEVRPNRLYRPCCPYPAGILCGNFGFRYPDTRCYDGGNIVMLADDLGYDKELPFNFMASWLYGADMHGNCVLGNVLFVGYTSDFEDYCGIAREELRRLTDGLNKLKLSMTGK